MPRLLACALACVALALASAPEVGARSASSPRHSGMEPPGGPRPLDGIPGASLGRTDEGGMGYTDVYGRSLTDKIPEERKPRHRPRPGAYGGAPKNPPDGLPDVRNEAPVWSFR